MSSSFKMFNSETGEQVWLEAGEFRKVCVMYSGAVEDADAYILSTMQLEEP